MRLNIIKLNNLKRKNYASVFLFFFCSDNIPIRIQLTQVYTVYSAMSIFISGLMWPVCYFNTFYRRHGIDIFEMSSEQKQKQKEKNSFLFWWGYKIKTNIHQPKAFNSDFCFLFKQILLAFFLHTEKVRPTQYIFWFIISLFIFI